MQCFILDLMPWSKYKVYSRIFESAKFGAGVGGGLSYIQLVIMKSSCSYRLHQTLLDRLVGINCVQIIDIPPPPSFFSGCYWQYQCRYRWGRHHHFLPPAVALSIPSPLVGRKQTCTRR